MAIVLDSFGSNWRQSVWFAAQLSTMLTGMGIQMMSTMATGRGFVMPMCCRRMSN